MDAEQIYSRLREVAEDMGFVNTSADDHLRYAAAAIASDSRSKED